MMPGIIKFALFISGLYQTRGRTCTPGIESGSMPVLRSSISIEWACPTACEAENTVLATLGSEPSITKATWLWPPAASFSAIARRDDQTSPHLASVHQVGQFAL